MVTRSERPRQSAAGGCGCASVRLPRGACRVTPVFGSSPRLLTGKGGKGARIGTIGVVRVRLVSWSQLPKVKAKACAPGVSNVSVTVACPDAGKWTR